VLSEGRCLPKNENNDDETPVAGKMINSVSDVSEIGSTTVTLVTSSNASGVLFAALHKLLSYIRFLNIEYSANLESVLKVKKSDSILVRYLPSIPQEVMKELFVNAKPIHPIFLYRRVSPTFLGNFWKISLLFGILITSSVLLTIMMRFFQNKGSSNIPCKICKVVRAIALKIFLMQFYLNFGDIVLFFILEIRSLQMKAFISGLSFFVALFFIIFGIGVFLSHLSLLKSIMKFSTLKMRHNGKNIDKDTFLK